MRLRSSETYWLLKNGLINSYPSLRQNLTCDVLIIGGGITGSLMAYQVASEGYKTVLIDKRDVSMGSTSATTGLLQYEIDEPLFSLIDKVGKDAAVDSYVGGVKSIQQLGKLVRSLKLDCGFERKASLFIAHDTRNREGLQKEWHCRAEAGIKVKWLSPQQLQEGFGVIGHGGILSETAASVDGYQLAHGLLAYAAANHGLEIYDHTAMESVDHDALHNYAYTQDAYTITCNKIIYATGYESQKMLKDKIVDLISTYACISEPMKKIPKPLNATLFWNTEDPYLYVRTTADNRILVGGADESFVNPERRDRIIEKKEAALLEKVGQLMPNIKIIPDFSWAGTFGVTKDSLPYMGVHPDHPNSYFVLGFGGNGITFSVMGMKIISDALAGKSNKFLDHFKFNR